MKNVDLNISNKRSWAGEWITQQNVRRKVMTAALTAEKSQLYEMEDGSLIPQLAQQVQFTVKVGNFLNPHLSFRRVPRFSSTVISSAFRKLICETPGKVKWLHWHTESEFEGLCFSAEVIGRKGEGSSKWARPFYQSMVGRQSDAANQRIWGAYGRKE